MMFLVTWAHIPFIMVSGAHSQISNCQTFSKGICYTPSFRFQISYFRQFQQVFVTTPSDFRQFQLVFVRNPHQISHFRQFQQFCVTTPPSDFIFQISDNFNGYLLQPLLCPRTFSFSPRVQESSPLPVKDSIQKSNLLPGIPML